MKALPMACLLCAVFHANLILATMSYMEDVQNDFAINFLKKTANRNGGTFISPYALLKTLFLLYSITDGETNEEIFHTLARNGSQEEFNSYILQFVLENKERIQNPLAVHSTNRFYISRLLAMKPGLPRIIQLFFNESAYAWDGRHKSEIAENINTWVARKTDNIVRSVFHSSNVESSADIWFLNMIFYDLQFKKAFKQSQKAMFFFSYNDLSSSLKWQFAKGIFEYYADDQVRFVRLPLISDSDSLECVIILPAQRFGLFKFLRTLSSRELINLIHHGSPHFVKVRIPEFTIENQLLMKNKLKSVGIKKLFAQNSDFSTYFYRPISIEQIIQIGGITFLPKKGSRRSLTPSSDIQNRSVPTVNFIADEPFLYLGIKNNKTILFAGKYDFD
ncbi:unnamed protein product [Thelazia callipaeda]|uniref:SERPIN domain-containing protein n=1 Tax=Thelazia callipaeda TaxID=103827 RepID=A0A0N5CKA2_THECL|nr:unnamed protein product [Thelazia callipaeda]